MRRAVLILEHELTFSNGRGHCPRFGARDTNIGEQLKREDHPVAIIHIRCQSLLLRRKIHQLLQNIVIVVTNADRPAIYEQRWRSGYIDRLAERNRSLHS